MGVSVDINHESSRKAFETRAHRHNYALLPLISITNLAERHLRQLGPNNAYGQWVHISITNLAERHLRLDEGSTGGRREVEGYINHESSRKAFETLSLGVCLSVNTGVYQSRI